MLTGIRSGRAVQITEIALLSIILGNWNRNSTIKLEKWPYPIYLVAISYLFIPAPLENRANRIRSDPNTGLHLLGLRKPGVYNPVIMNETNTDRPAVIFDMDGVLVDSYQAHFQSWNRMLAGKGLRLSPEEFAQSFGRTNQDIIPETWPEQAGDPETVAAWSREKEEAYREILRERFPEMSGAGELIHSLHEAGFDLAIGSSGPPENIQVVLDCLDHSDCFQAQVTGSDVRRGKPDPEVFLKAAEKLGVPPQRCAVVEDALAGLEAARRAGMLPIALTGTTDPRALAENAHAVVDSLSQLDPQQIRNWLKDR